MRPQDEPNSEPVIAEDLLLLALDDETGRLPDSETFDLLLGAALLAQLVLDSAVEVVPLYFGPFRRTPRFEVVDPDTVSDELLRDLVRHPTWVGRRTAWQLIELFSLSCQNALLQRLITRGMIEPRDEQRWFRASRTVWPTVDGSHEKNVRNALDKAILEGDELSDHQAVLVAFTLRLNALHLAADNRPSSNLGLYFRGRSERVMREREWSRAGVQQVIDTYLRLELKRSF